MNIGIDITSLIYQRGVSRYTSNLVRALAVQPHVELSLFGYSLRQNTLLKKMACELIDYLDEHQLKTQPYPPKIQSLLWRLGLNKIQKQLPKIDVFHSWDWLQPPDKDIPLVSTIHDLAIVKYPDTAHPSILKAHKRSWKILRERQAEIIAVSQSTKKDIVKMLKIPAYKIHVIAEALPVEIRQTSDWLTEEKEQEIKNKLQLHQPYILFVGTREPRKNLARIIKAWEPLADKYQLIIAGDSGWDDSAQFQQPNLRFLGRVSEEELNVLYAEADCFAYASLYEGFGLPILEAFHHGTPVVTSDISAMVEVAGNAAELVDPKSEDSIRQGLKKILNETAEEQQKRLQRMIIRLQMFSWDKVAKETIQVYQKAIQDFAEKK